MAQNPYRYQTGYEPEYNPNGDFANGAAGGATPAAGANAVMQKATAKPGGNPFELMLQHSQKLRQAAGKPPMGAQPQFPAVVSRPNTGVVPPLGAPPAIPTAPPGPAQRGGVQDGAAPPVAPVVQPGPPQFGTGSQDGRFVATSGVQPSPALMQALTAATPGNIVRPSGPFVPVQSGAPVAPKGVAAPGPPVMNTEPTQPRFVTRSAAALGAPFFFNTFGDNPAPTGGGALEDGELGGGGFGGGHGGSVDVPPPGVIGGPVIGGPSSGGGMSNGAPPTPTTGVVDPVTPTPPPPPVVEPPPDEGDPGRGRIVAHPTPPPPPPEGISQPTWDRINRYVNDDPRYSWLLDKAWLWDQFSDEMARQKETFGEEGIDFVDWLQHRVVNTGNNVPNPAFMRNGFDTTTHKLDANGNIVRREYLQVGLQGGAGGTGSGLPPGDIQPTPVETGPPPPAVVNPPPPVDTNPPPPVRQEPPIDEPPPDVLNPPPVDDNPPPPVRDEPPPVDPATESNDANAIASEIDKLMKGVSPLNTAAQNALARQLRHQAGVSGLANSGGFGETFGTAMGGLINEQSAALADKAFGAGQSALDRGLQKYIADQSTRTKLRELETTTGMQKYLADLSATVEREKMKTNRDLEMGKLDLEKYGIDKGDLLARYKAELELSGQKYSADAAINSAKLHAAASKAGASASAHAAKYDADVRRELGILGYDVAREGNLQQFLMGIAGLGPEWAKLILGAGSQNLIPGVNPPGTVIVHP